MKVYLKTEGEKRPYNSASNIIDDKLSEDNQLIFCMPKKPLLVKSINRARSKGRSANVRNLDVIINVDNIPAHYLISDVNNNEHSHLILMTHDQIILLSKAVTWYVDATFSIVKRPFYQLFVIHAFVIHGLYII